jgi:hypothetical protein
MVSSPGATYRAGEAAEVLSADASTTELCWDGSATACTAVPGAEKVVIEPMSSW